MGLRVGVGGEGAQQRLATRADNGGSIGHLTYDLSQKECMALFTILVVVGPK